MKDEENVSWLVWLLMLAWLLPGLIGHDPWKPDEAYSMGLVYHILETDDWVVPTLAKEPFMEKPPLYFLTAALTAHGFSSQLPLHDGARLASGFYIGLVLIFAALTGRTLYGKGHGNVTMLILMGCIGLLPHAHLMITDTSLLAGFSIAFYGIALSRRCHLWGGALLGLGTGIGFMSKGLLAPFVLGGIVVTLPLLSSDWRNRRFMLSLGMAALTSLPWLTLWPSVLYHRAPELFHTWLWENNFGRFFGFSELATQQESGYYLKALSWFTWPALPLALVTLWKRRSNEKNTRNAYLAPELLFPLVAGVILLAVLMLSSATRELYILPLLLPLSIMAAPIISENGIRHHRILSCLTVTFFSGLALLVWLVWFLAVSRIPLGAWIGPVFPDEFFIMQEKGGVPFQGMAFTLALLASGVWYFNIRRFTASSQRMMLGWTGGITLIWLLLMTLWLPVIDYGKSYQMMVMDMKEKIPVDHTCMVSRGLGEPQRAMLHYFGQILTHRVENGFHEEQCDLLLISSHPEAVATLSPNGHKLWEGGRPGDKKERYVLYQTP